MGQRSLDGGAPSAAQWGMATQRDDEFPTHADADAERPVDEELIEQEESEVVEHVPDDVDPADYVDQHRAVPLDDDHDT